MQHGLVSTIIPVFNRPGMVREAAVFDASVRPVEIVIVDDGSTDGTPLECRSPAAYHSDIVRVVRQENRGPGLAREAGRQVARGEFIQYLDSDDWINPRKLRGVGRQVNG